MKGNSTGRLLEHGDDGTDSGRAYEEEDGCDVDSSNSEDEFSDNESDQERENENETGSDGSENEASENEIESVNYQEVLPMDLDVRVNIGDENGNDGYIDHSPEVISSEDLTKPEITCNIETRDGKEVAVIQITNPLTPGDNFVHFEVKKEKKDHFVSVISNLNEEIGNQIKTGGGSSKKKKCEAIEINMDTINSIISNLTPQARPNGRPGGRAGGLGGGNDGPTPSFVDPALTFAEIGGLDTHIKYLRDNVIFPFVNPDSLKEFNGGSAPKGIMLYGVPGSGKTLLACALSNELSNQLGKRVAFYHRKGPDSFSSYVGETEEILAALFDEAKKNKPSIIFFDELDGLCPSRDRTSGNGGGGEAYVTVVTTLLGLMDNVVPGEVLVIGATNRIESVDAAMLRSGRFDKRLVFHPPDEMGRKKIIEINLEKWDRSERPSGELITRIAKETTGFTGADLQKLCRDAFLKAFDRHVPNFNLNSNINDLKVLPEDWIAAMKGMIRTSSLTFGSFLYVPLPFQAEMLPLISRHTQAILKDLETLYPLRAIKGGEHFEKSLGYNGYLITDEVEKNGYTLDNILVSDLLSSRFLAKCPVYIISEDTITNNSSYLQAIEQAIDSSFAILLIQRLDYLIRSYPDHCQQIATHLEQLRGKPCLLLATATCKPGDLANAEFKCHFNGNGRSYTVQSTTPEERKAFFRPIFEEKVFREKNAKNNFKKTHGGKIAELETFCIQNRRNASCTKLLELFEKLSLCCSSSTASDEDFINNLEKIVDSYA